MSTKSYFCLSGIFIHSIMSSLKSKRLTIKKATSLLKSYFGYETPQSQAAISLLKQGYYANPSYRFNNYKTNYPKIIEKCGGLPSFNYERHDIKLISDPLDNFPVFDIEGKSMQFVAQVFFRDADSDENVTIKGMLFIFIEYQDAENYDESCPLCKVIHDPNIPAGYFSFTKEHADDIGMTSDRLELYHRGISIIFHDTLTLPERDLLLMKFPDLFTFGMLMKYDQKVLNKGRVDITSTLFGGNPRVLQGYPINPDEKFLMQMYDPRPISSENYMFYFALKQTAYDSKDFSEVTIWGQST